MLKNSKEQYENYLLDLALKKDELSKFICGIGFYEITALQGMNGEIGYSCVDTMSTIYRRYNKDNSENIPILTEEAFCKIFDNYKSDVIINALKAFNYHMYCEKDGSAPFKLDCHEILEKARKNLIDNKDLFQNGQYPFWDDLENVDKNLSEGHGIHIM